MVTFFEQEDLISFGDYMISEERKQSILQSEGVSDKIKQQALLGVTPFDYENWYALRLQQSQYEEYDGNEDEDGIVEYGLVEDEDLSNNEVSE